MDTDDVLTEIGRVLGSQDKVILVVAGVAWEAHISRLSRGSITAIAKPAGAFGERVEREFQVSEITDIATVLDEPDVPAGHEDDDLNKLSRELIQRADQATDPSVERALRAAQYNLIEAQLAEKRVKGSGHGGQHHRSAAGGTAVGGVTTDRRQPANRVGWLDGHNLAGPSGDIDRI